MNQAFKAPRTRGITDKAHELFKMMVDNDLSAAAAGEILGIQPPSAHSRIKTAVRAVGIPALVTQYPGLVGKIKGTEPSKISTALLDASATDKLRRREITEIKPGQELEAINSKLRQALSYLDSTVLATSKASELTSVIKTLFEVSQTIQGKPSNITASQNIKALDALLPQVIREASRRGIVIEGEIVNDAIEVPGARVVSDSAGSGLDATPLGDVAHPPVGVGVGGVQRQEGEEFFDPFKI